MIDFELPPIRNAAVEKRILSMDDFLDFVMFNNTYAFDKKAYEERKKLLTVNVAFSLKNSGNAK